MGVISEQSQHRRLHEFQLLIYAGAAFGLLLFIAWFLALIFYGVRPHPVLLSALLSAILFVIAAATTEANPQRARIIAVFACLAASPLWIVWIIGVVPAHDVVFALPIPHLLVVAYLILLGFVLFWPKHFRFSIVLFTLVFCAGVVVAWQTYTKRVASGEYDQPGVASFRWTPDMSGRVVLTRDSNNWIDQRVLAVLNTAGISGTLQWSGVWGEQSARNRMILLLKEKPPLGTRLYPPRQGVLMYAFDGSKWIKVPENMPTYSSFFSIEESEGHTMLYENTAGGKAGTQIWPSSQ
jgi:hypothetical protein